MKTDKLLNFYVLHLPYLEKIGAVHAWTSEKE